jgi:DtxR family Mn-dependent transcriptional regulator
MSGPLISLLVLAATVGLGVVLFRPERGIVPRIARARRLASRVLIEDALKHIHESEYRGHVATLLSLAGALSISVNEASALATRMEARELLRTAGDGLTLTPAGRQHALQVIRAHRLWERYLAEETGVAEAAWHGKAERREHRLTPPETDALSARLGHPRWDPHGDPIPTAGGEVPSLGGAIPLSDLALDRRARIVHVEDEPPAVYAQIVAAGLHVGLEVRVTEATAERVLFWAGGDEHVLAPVVAAGVSVVELPASETAEVERRSERLSALEPGESAEIVGISGACRGLERRRLMDLGVVPGTRIEAVLRSPSGDPTAYRLRGTTIAIRRRQAERIRIRRPEEEAA